MTLSTTCISPGQIQTKAIQPHVSFARRIDLALLGLLLLFILLYRLQFVAEWIVNFRVREVLYAILYVRALLHYKPRVTRILLLVLLYLGYCLFVGIHTLFLYGFEMASKGLMRFVNVALLAPLFAIMITRKQQLEKFINMWLAVAYLGAISGVYQFMGGDLQVLTGGYTTWRGETLRFMTLLGEPNIGGMASPIVLLAAVYIVRNRIWKTVTALVALVLLLLSVSKAAYVGFALGILLIIFLQSRRRDSLAGSGFQRTFLFVVSLFALIVVCVLILSFSNPDVMNKVQVYAQTAKTALSGGGDRYDVSPSFIDDLLDRLFAMTSDGIERAKAESSFYALNIVGGSSFGIAGTAAEEVRGQEAVITPHNGFSETFFVGGVSMLLLFLVMIFFVWKRLLWLSKGDNLFTALLASFILCVAFTAGYPIMSSIFVGSFFWLTVGAAANRSMTRHELLTQG